MKRLDILIFEKGFAESRTMAQALINNGSVEINGKMAVKPSEKVNEDADIRLTGELPKYVSRGGYKLETAVNEFGISFKNTVCLDIGASTGGFTDCMLQNGAVKVYAVDVGREQLSRRLREDSRVISLEKTDIRTLVIPEKVDIITVDVSFISLKLVIPLLGDFLKPSGSVTVLIKPQFEVGKTRLKNGILKDKKKRAEIVSDIESFIITKGYEIIGTVKSEISGADGNEEFLVYFKRSL